MNHYIWQEIKWPSFTWRNEELLDALSRCRFLQGKLLGRGASLGLELKKEAQAEILIAEAHETSAIEGKEVPLEAVRSSVARRLSLSDAGIPQDRYADGVVDILLDATINFERNLTENRIHGWQAALFHTGYSGIHEIAVGNFRGDIPLSPGNPISLQEANR